MAFKSSYGILSKARPHLWCVAMKLLLIIVQNTEEVAKLLPFLECQTLWRSFLRHNVPFLKDVGWRDPEGLARKYFILKMQLTSWTMCVCIYILFSSFQPFILNNIRSVTFPVSVTWEQQGLTVSKAVSLGKPVTQNMLWGVQLHEV